ncbi:cysteine desulfurase family protein [Jeotgalibacillus marinus]|uniref:cysteine desulfurase n=1 Tax=Jeotgalibacillus marinus TaxID=86667 RepID=A0ABV3Q639_9BACL
MLYLDNSATTPILPEVREQMFTYLENEYGNPSGKYYKLATDSKQAVKKAREHICKLFNSTENEIVFTSGSTESNNMIIKGVADYYAKKGKHIITSKAEHVSVLDVCIFLEKKGFEITYLDVDSYGRVNPNDLELAIRDDTILISIIWANNETGSLNDISTLSTIAQQKNVLFHTDATQAVGKIEINWAKIPGVGFLSASAHKVFGPKGIGISIIREDEYKQSIPFTPLIHGGGQENNMRSGTYAVHNIVGFGEAAKLANERLIQNSEQMKLLESSLTQILKNKFNDHISFNSDDKKKIPGVVNVRFIGVNNEILLKKLAPIIAASSGSACSSSKPSHVLQAMGFSLKEVRESIRFSLSPYQSLKEMKVFEQL